MTGGRNGSTGRKAVSQRSNRRHVARAAPSPTQHPLFLNKTGTCPARSALDGLVGSTDKVRMKLDVRKATAPLHAPLWHTATSSDFVQVCRGNWSSLM